MEILPCVEINPPVAPQSTIIWLHGLGADGHDFEPIVPELNLEWEAVRFVFPHAPVRPVTINGGMQMRAWYDIAYVNLSKWVDEEAIAQSSAQLVTLIEREILSGIPAERIVLAGFSQGGVIVLNTALRYPHKLAGVIALSTYLPNWEKVSTELSQANRTTPFFMAHGTLDPVVPFDEGKLASQHLMEKDYPVTFKQYPMPHAVCGDEVFEIAQVLKNWLGNAG